VFGLIIGMTSSFQGMKTSGGIDGAGRSATSAVLLSSLFIILADVHSAHIRVIASFEWRLKR